jgi:hypothetical protein
MMLDARSVSHLRDQLSAAHRAHMLASLDAARGRHGLGTSLHHAIHAPHGGSLPVFLGKGDPPSATFYENHIGHGLAMYTGNGLPVFGEGFFSFIKKIGSLGHKAIKKVAEHGTRALAENKDALMGIAKGAASHVLNSEGSLGDRLKGGIAKAATETHDLARSQMADRIKGLIS